MQQVNSLETEVSDLTILNKSIEQKLKEQETQFSTAEGRQKHTSDKIKRLEKDNGILVKQLETVKLSEKNLREELKQESQVHFAEVQNLRETLTKESIEEFNQEKQAIISSYN